MMSSAYAQTAKLEKDLLAAKEIEDAKELSFCYRDTIIPDMKELRVNIDSMEMISDSAAWPYPSYGELLFSIR